MTTVIGLLFRFPSTLHEHEAATPSATHSNSFSNRCIVFTASTFCENPRGYRANGLPAHPALLRAYLGVRSSVAHTRVIYPKVRSGSLANFKAGGALFLLCASAISVGQNAPSKGRTHRSSSSQAASAPSILQTLITPALSPLTIPPLNGESMQTSVVTLS